MGVEAFFEVRCGGAASVQVNSTKQESPAADLHVQHDFHRYHVYFNAGVMLMRRSEWMTRLLAEAYDSHRVILLRNWLYGMAEQDALNFASARSMRRPRGTPAGAAGWKVQIHSYPRLWVLPHESLEVDGHVAADVLCVHFPNCKGGECATAFAQAAALALAMPTNVAPARGARRTFPPEMERLTHWSRLVGEG